MKNINEVARIKKILYCVKKKLVHCAVLNCTKSSSKKIDNTFSFFKLLKDPRRRKKLIAKLKRANLLKDKNLHVCRKHFEENCFQRDLKVSSIFLIVTKICSWAHQPDFTFYFDFKMQWIFLKSSFCLYNLVFFRIKEITSQQDQWI